MLTHHKVRELLVAQRTQLINALRGHLAEIGVIAAQGPTNAHDLAELIEEGDEAIAAAVRAALKPVVRQLNIFDAEIAQSDRAIQEISRADDLARRLMNTRPGTSMSTRTCCANG